MPMRKKKTEILQGLKLHSLIGRFQVTAVMAVKGLKMLLTAQPCKKRKRFKKKKKRDASSLEVREDIRDFATHPEGMRAIRFRSELKMNNL